MKYALNYVPAAVVIGGLLALSASAQETAPAAVVPTPTGPTQEVSTPPTPGTPEHSAQLQREHKRALVSGDHANDPLNPASSNDLNQKELAKALALGTDPVPAEAASPPPTPEAPMQATEPAAKLPPATDSAPPPAGDSLKPDTSSVQ
jgi:hypothetical protein